MTKIYDFDNLEEAVRFVAENDKKSSVMFTEMNDADVDASKLTGEIATLFSKYGKYIAYQDYKSIFGENVVDNYYSVEMKSAYKDFECGW